MSIVEKVLKLLEDGNYTEMNKIIDDVVSTGNDDIRFLLGEQMYQFGFFDEAERLFSSLLINYPNEGELLIILAEILMEKGEEDEAVLLLEKIPQNDEVYPQALLLLADLYEMEGLFEVTEQKLLEAKQILPNERAIDYALGEFYADQGSFVKAIAAYEKVLKDDRLQKEVNIDEKIAEVLSASGKFEEALPYYDKALQNNLDIDTLFQYGLTALQANNNKLAIKKLSELKDLDYEYHSLYLLLAEAYEAEGLLEKSLETIKQGIAVDKFNKELFLYGGKVALKLYNENKAENLFREAIALDPGYTEAVITLSALLRKNEQWDDLLALLTEVSKYGQDDPQYTWDRAIAYENLEKYSEALNEYEIAYTFFKDDEAFLNNYGYFLIEEGKFDVAVEVFNRLLKKDPSNEEYIEIMERLTDY